MYVYNINVYMYTCVCMCVCVYIYTYIYMYVCVCVCVYIHTHIHKHIHELWGSGPRNKCQGTSWAVCRLRPHRTEEVSQAVVVSTGQKAGPGPTWGISVSPHSPPRSSQLLQLSSAPLTWLAQKSMYQWCRMASCHPHDRVANAHSFSLVTLLHVCFFLTAPCSLWDPSSLTRD